MPLPHGLYDLLLTDALGRAVDRLAPAVADLRPLDAHRPMSIEWTLGVPLPPKLFAEFSVLRG